MRLFRSSSLLVIILILLIIPACVDPILIKKEQPEPRIVIDGFFTDQPEFNTVRISTSADFSNNHPFVSFNAPLEGAKVKVFSSDGTQSFDFIEIEKGLYKTDGAGSVGQAYYAVVTLNDGTKYRSEIEQISNPVPIGPFSFTIDEETIIQESSGSFLELKQHYFNIYASVKDPMATKNYYLWKAYGTFEYLTVPVGDGACFCACYAPLYPLLNTVNVVSDQYFDGGTVNRKVASIKYDRKTRFLTKLYQFSINKKSYEFWNSVYEQQSSVGSIFDPTAQQITGNLYNEGNRDEPVLGFFTTAAVTTNHFLIHRGKEADLRGIIEVNLADMLIGNDCRVFYHGATAVKPIEFYD